jgi:hypothetical protein
MKYLKVLVGILLLGGALACAQNSAPLPVIKQNGAVKQLFVDNKPFIMLSGELHNSTASSAEYMKPVFDNLAALHLNTVIGTVSWELIEPEEGHFDFSSVDAQITEARRTNMRLVLIWFGTYKTAHSSYVPAWVKADRKRFPPMVFNPRPDRRTLFPLGALSVGEGGIGALSPFGQETLKADAAAFRALMRHLREFDPQHTVIMVQVENEPGAFGDSRDRSPLAEAAWAGLVPSDLLGYMVQHKTALMPELLEIWGRNGYKSSGTWAEVFGTDERADEIFMGYYAGRFVGEVAKAGKAELNLPMFVNAFLVIPGLLPGQYPSGGPVHRLIDVYHVAAPAIDVLSPNAYSPDFKGICALYARGGNPLLIPETGAVAGNLFWAVGHHAALAWSPFGSVESLKPEGQIGAAYRALASVMQQLTQWQAEGKVDAILVVDGEDAKPISLGGYKISLVKERGFMPALEPQPAGQSGAPAPAAGAQPSTATPAPLFGPPANDKRPFAIVINTAPDEFLFIGANGVPKFTVNSSGPANVAVAAKDDGRYENGKWVPGRRLNGDEVGQGLPDAGIGMLMIKLVRFD